MSGPPIQRFAVVLIVGLLASSAAPGVAADAKTQETMYVPGLVAITVICGSEEHGIVPQGHDPAAIVSNPLGWALSGEPECAGADAMNAQREAADQDRAEWGSGGAGHLYDQEDAGSLATARATDEVFGDGAGHLTVLADSEEGLVASEGCGPQSIVLPPPSSHYQVDPPPPVYWWAFVDSVALDEDLTPCFATTGVLHGTWGA